MIGLDTGYFFRLAEKTDQSIELLHTAMEEEREVVAQSPSTSFSDPACGAVWIPPSSISCWGIGQPSAGSRPTRTTCSALEQAFPTAWGFALTEAIRSCRGSALSAAKK